MPGFYGTTQGFFIQAVPGQLLLQAQTLCGTPGSFGAQSSGTAQSVSSSFRGVSPLLQPLQVNGMEWFYCQVLGFERISDAKIIIYRGSPFPALLQALWQLTCPLEMVLLFSMGVFRRAAR